MKSAIKLALFGAVLAAGAANAQTITHTPSTAGGSDLILFAWDPASTTNTFFTQDLGNPLDSIYSKAQVVADGVITVNKTFTTPTNIAGPDAALQSWLSANSGSLSSVVWTIMAGDNTTVNNNLGSRRGLVTSSLDLSGGNPIGTSTTFSAVNVGTFASHLSTLVNQVNSTYGGGNNSTAVGFGDALNGANAPISWVSSSLANGASLGTAQTMFLAATNGNGAGPANLYVGGMVDVLSTGVIEVTNAGAVPLPGAVWLFGSGLLGLIGIGRRRTANTAA
jgi:hypothetical protein